MKIRSMAKAHRECRKSADIPNAIIFLAGKSLLGLFLARRFGSDYYLRPLARRYRSGNTHSSMRPELIYIEKR